MKRYKYPSVLTIAGFDSSGGAGMQADIKTISALGCYATCALTALPIQNTMGVKSIFTIPESVVEEQLHAVFDDIFPDAVKIGMVHSRGLVDVISRVLSHYPHTPVVFDPVMVSTSGHRLIEDETIQSLVAQLFPIADVVTPNLDEAEVLTGMKISTVEEMYEGGEKIKGMGCSSVLMKGGHLKQQQLTSIYFASDGTTEEYHSEKYETNNTHGSGCTLSSAIASFLARGETPGAAVKLAQDYVQSAIFHGLDVQTGKGNGPLNHFFHPHRLIKKALLP